MNAELLAALVGALAGLVFALPIGYALASMQRTRDAKDRFIAIISRQEALLDRSRERLFTHFSDSVVPLHDAVFAVKPFVSESAFSRLKKLWEEYKLRGQKEKDWSIRTSHGVLKQVLGASPTLSDKYADEWIADYLGRFKKIVG